MRSWFREKKKGNWLVLFLILFGFLFVLVFLYARFLHERESDAQHHSEENAYRPVKVMTPVPSSGSIYTEVLGRVRGKQTVLVRATVSGWVKRVDSGRGQEIEKDGIILELYDYRVETRLDEAKYNLESARGKFAEADRVYQRNTALFEKGIVSEDETEASRNLLETASAGVKALEASYNRAKWNYENLKIRSPIQGQIIEIVPDIGQETRSGDVVAKVVNLSGRKVIAGVDVSVARSVKRGDALEVSLARDGTVETVTGEVDGVSPGSDDFSGTYDIEIAISDPSIKWWPGEMVSVRIPVQKLDNVVRIPKTAVLSDSREAFFFVLVEKNGEVLKVKVAPTWIDDSSAYISFASLPEDSRIITEGNFGLLPGHPVRVVD
ncbi:MAG: efflux RND transporter periplasmic adaptor subunit [Candidatus Dadabacteria bacterium]|nr:efflux RND transporter periplasmic adaptor subunit [Candidatus Dadabacteria bacterium]MYA47907.1 efflux RND transporter periplasmic adaptor subunit [Candidatus Dadabacteria bacterium]MYG83076.1 efflux RND transporter periplasmic adaptor subunit [Candidatus Dadabacteria bacterium]MYK49313.1 efflux RND transporter periplasmic adaptor subunit [Candidatus Dadabacteria bacterium]